MFRSATLKLTGWYLIILMTISIIFSVGIYTIASTEVRARLTGLQVNIESDQGNYILPPDHDFLDLRRQQVQAAELHLAISLFYANVTILICGGAGAYFLARRTLAPIQAAHETQSRFVSDASHELRTPLTAMQMELEVALREKNLSKDDVHEILTSNLEEVNKLSRLSNVLLQISRSENDDIERTPTNISAAIKAVAARYDKTGQRLKVSLPKKPVSVLANDVSLEELLTILTDNALKYSPTDSVVELGLTHDAHWATFTITNAGEGIASDKLPYIFDRFYRASSSRTGQEKPGFGLGLSLAKRIVELNRGTLSASSGEQQLTTFTVKLPLADSHSKK